MTYSIRQATVIGAGTMGAGIAAHLANAGLSVFLIDVLPDELTPKEMAKGLDAQHPLVRNRLAREGLARLQATPTLGFFSPKNVARVTIGNLEDNFDWVGESDWVIEAVIEDMAIKRALMKRIDEIRQPGSIITTNTSGLPIKDIAQETSDDFAGHFLGTHFFNPPRIMKLLEIIPGPQTAPSVLDFMIRFCEEALGKGVVVCKDTPNFIANRIAAIQRSYDMEHVLSNGYNVEEADAVLGPAIGRPKTALFRLADLVGIDVSTKVGKNLFELIPHDPFRENLIGPLSGNLREKMIEAKLLGRKTKAGFYKRVKTPEGMQFWGLDLESLEYREPQLHDFPRLEKASQITELAERIRFLISEEDRVGMLVWASVKNSLMYAASCIPEISDSLISVDRAMRWGYAWEIGPFELWDALGVQEMVQRIEAGGHTVADWVQEMIDAGIKSFYKLADGERYQYSPSSSDYQLIPDDPRVLSLTNLREKSGSGIKIRPKVSLLDLDDGVAFLDIEAHSKGDTGKISNAIESALELVIRDYEGLVISKNESLTSAGIPAAQLLELIRQENFSALDNSLERMQALHVAIRSFPLPVVFVSSGRVTGGDAILALASSQICTSAETYMGYEEVALGLLPPAGGCKELMRRVFTPILRISGLDPLPALRHIFDVIAYAKVSGSALEAREFGLLTERDEVVINQDHLLARAKNMVLAKVVSGLGLTAPDTSVYVMGERGKAVLEVSIYLLREAGYASEHDQLIAHKLAHILCGGDLTSPQWVDEKQIMDLEREAYLSLCGEEKTLARIEHFMKTGKRLRN